MGRDPKRPGDRRRGVPVGAGKAGHGVKGREWEAKFDRYGRHAQFVKAGAAERGGLFRELAKEPVRQDRSDNAARSARGGEMYTRRAKLGNGFA